jgi:ArsR family transcriptional regulator, arsenate/arsenite/antimonite-responsive transcriptional repressor
MATFAVPRAANALAALGHEARLEIFRALVRAGDDGLPVYLIQERLGGMPRSTLAHHLQTLVQAGLVAQRKVGAEVVNRAEFAAMHALVSYLTDECCEDASACAPGVLSGATTAAAAGGSALAGEGRGLGEP